MVGAEPAAPSGRSMRLEVGGRVLTVRSDAPEDRVSAVVDEVNERLARIQRQSRSVSSDHVLRLTLLNLAEELVALRERHAALKATVQDRGERLLATLDQLTAEPLDREPSNAPTEVVEG